MAADGTQPGNSSRDQRLDRVAEVLLGRLQQLADSELSTEPSTLVSTDLLRQAIRDSNEDAEPWDDATTSDIAAGATTRLRRVLAETVREKRLHIGIRVQLMEGGALSASEFLDLNAALDRLEKIGERPARVAELRLFADLPVERIAEVLGVSAHTVREDWAFAKAFLRRTLGM